jgi:hypothetical protein
MSLVLKHEDIFKQDNTDHRTEARLVANVWTWETCKFTLINPSGEEVELNSLHINDFTLGHIREDLEKYVEETHKGVLRVIWFAVLLWLLFPELAVWLFFISFIMISQMT